MVRAKGSDIWFKSSVKELLPSQYPHKNYVKGNQVFDVNFDTGLSWDFVLR